MNEFADIHAGAIRLLSRVFAAGKLSHAYLIAGPEGSGKQTLARRLAAGVVCAEQRFPPCGACSSCRKVGRKEHPDVAELQPEMKTGYSITQIRELITRLQLHSYEGGWKVGMIANIDTLMKDEAKNAFLKTLEEPPNDTVLILTCQNLQRILPTIISRCQLLRLTPMPREAIRGMVRSRGLSDYDAGLVAEFAQGNAVKAAEMDLNFVLDFRRQLLAKMVEIEKSDLVGMLEFAAVMAKVDYPQYAVLDLIAGFYEDVLYLKLGRDDIRNRDLAELAANEARALSLPRVLERIETVLTARRRALGNANSQINWEILIMSVKGVEGAAITRVS